MIQTCKTACDLGQLPPDEADKIMAAAKKAEEERILAEKRRQDAEFAEKKANENRAAENRPAQDAATDNAINGTFGLCAAVVGVKLAEQTISTVGAGVSDLTNPDQQLLTAGNSPLVANFTGNTNILNVTGPNKLTPYTAPGATPAPAAQPRQPGTAPSLSLA